LGGGGGKRRSNHAILSDRGKENRSREKRGILKGPIREIRARRKNGKKGKDQDFIKRVGRGEAYQRVVLRPKNDVIEREIGVVEKVPPERPTTSYLEKWIEKVKKKTFSWKANAKNYTNFWGRCKDIGGEKIVKQKSWPEQNVVSCGLLFGGRGVIWKSGVLFILLTLTEGEEGASKEERTKTLLINISI